MLDMGKQTSQFFDSYVDTYGRKRYQLKSLEKYSREHNTNEQPGKKYFTHSTLPEIIKAAPIPAQRAKPQEAEKGVCSGTHSSRHFIKKSVLTGTTRAIQSTRLHRLCARAVEPESDREMDASTGSYTSLHHWREVYWTFCGKSLSPSRRNFHYQQ
jgi:hypothetical protein